MPEVSFKEYYIQSLKYKDIDPHIWMMNYLCDRLELNENQVIWLCFLFGVTYNLPTAYLILNEYPDLEFLDIRRFEKWWKEVQMRCPYQTDKIKQRKFTPETIFSYQQLIGREGQFNFFKRLLNSNDPCENFNKLWECIKNIRHFGRFSNWNFAQALKQVALMNIDADDILLGNADSMSFTHGLCYAFGRPEWVVKNKLRGEDGKIYKGYYRFTEKDKEYLNSELLKIKNELINEGYPVDNFLLETVACAYKKIFRERDSRYVGYYLDRQGEDIVKLEKNGWNGVDWSILRQARDELLDSNMIHYKVNKEFFKGGLLLKLKSYNYE